MLGGMAGALGVYKWRFLPRRFQRQLHLTAAIHCNEPKGRVIDRVARGRQNAMRLMQHCAVVLEGTNDTAPLIRQHSYSTAFIVHDGVVLEETAGILIYRINRLPG